MNTINIKHYLRLGGEDSEVLRRGIPGYYLQIVAEFPYFAVHSTTKYHLHTTVDI